MGGGGDLKEDLVLQRNERMLALKVMNSNPYDISTFVVVYMPR